MERIEPLDYRASVNVDGVQIRLLPAGHVLGAAMTQLEVDNIRILYTGDYSFEPDRHLAVGAGRALDHDDEVLANAHTVTVQLPRCAGSHAADAATLVELTGCSAAPPATLPLGRTAKLYMRGKSSSSSVQSKARSCTTVVSAMAGASKPIHSCPPNGGVFIVSVT
jgi:hypothetical protein